MIAQESKKYLNPENKTITTIFLLPLLFDNRKILYNKYGFVNAFIEDINRPWLDNHIFVLFKTSSISDSIEKDMRNNKYFYDVKQIVIDNNFYEEYIFIIPPEYKKSLETFKTISYNILTVEDKIKVLKFWGLEDIPYINILLNSNPEYAEFENDNIVPEEDSVDEFNELNSKIFLQQLGF